MKFPWILIPAFACLFFISCSGNKKNKDHHNDVTPEKGSIHESIQCGKNKTISYALYQPSAMSENKTYPIIIAFDAHARGVRPVELLKEAAEKYGYIVAGSNFSKNGQQWEVTASQYDIMLADLLERFPVDKNRIYTCGFSGGSRVAASVALFKGGIAGVIGCSAGFPQVKEAIRYKFDYIGFAGSDDMNYIEMANLDAALENSGFRHQLIVFQGTHEWPSAGILAEALIWSELNAMKDGKKIKNTEFINDVFKGFNDSIQQLQQKGRIYEEYMMLKKTLNYFDGLADTDSIRKTLAQLEKKPAVKNAIAAMEYQQKKELALQMQYAKSLNEESAAWWKNEILKLEEFLKHSVNEEEKHLVKRVLEYLSLAAFSTTNAYMSQNDMEKAAHFAEIYDIIDNDNPEPEFMLARIAAMSNQKELALKHLDEAAKLGFSENLRVQNDTVFLKLNSELRFAEIVEKFKRNAAKE